MAVGIVITVKSDAPRGQLSELIAGGDDQQTVVNLREFFKRVAAGTVNAEIDVCTVEDDGYIDDGYFASGSFLDGDGTPSYTLTNITKSYDA